MSASTSNLARASIRNDADWLERICCQMRRGGRHTSSVGDELNTTNLAQIASTGFGLNSLGAQSATWRASLLKNSPKSCFSLSFSDRLLSADFAATSPVEVTTDNAERRTTFTSDVLRVALSRPLKTSARTRSTMAASDLKCDDDGRKSD